MRFSDLLGHARPYRASLAACSVLMVLEGATALAVPWLGGRFAGDLLDGDGGSLDLLLAALLAVFALQAVLRFASRYLSGRTTARILADIRIRLYDHLQALPLDYHQRESRGGLMALATHEAAQLGGYIGGTLLGVVPLLLAAAGSVALMFAIDPRLALLVMLLVPLFYLLLKIVGRRLRPLARRLQEAEADTFALVEENLGLLPAVKVFTREDHETVRHRASVGRVLDLSVTGERIHAVLEPAVQFAAAACVILVLWLAGAQVRAGDLGPGELVSFLLYAALLTRPVAGLAAVYGQTQMARGTLQRLAAVLGEQPEPRSGGREIGRLSGAVSFRGVCFAYPGRPPALDGVDLEIAAGERVALTGVNGAGKSTLVHLLLRLHAPSAGSILVDGIDIAEANLPSLRRQIGLVPQHVLLLNGTVRDNIAYGRPDADEAAIARAARAAQADGFIATLPQGYDTPVGDGGVRLSGGQRQRLALARALLTDPPLLVLDEATAMFDPAGERAFVEAADDALAGRTVILITHRPESLALADRIVTLDSGRVAQDHRRIASTS